MTIEELLKYELQEIRNIIEVELSFTEEESNESVKKKILDACDYMNGIYDKMMEELPGTDAGGIGIVPLTVACFAQGNANSVRKRIEKMGEELGKGVLFSLGIVLLITLQNMASAFRQFPKDFAEAKQG